ncbi:MAG: serine/threonine-protein kinase [Chthoniobacteraceae bacterium]
MNSPEPAMNTCNQCGQPMAGNAPEGLCARCLLSAAVGAPASSPATTTTHTPAGGTPALHADFPDIGDMADVARRLPQFEFLSLLGRGGMGVVYKARQLQLDRIVALKILPPADALSPDFVERFRREARSLAKLSHPNIVGVHDFGESGGLYYFAMEFVDGVNLRDMIRSGKMKPEEAIAVVPKICDALQFAHEEGVVHRDIKPENILIDKRGRVKIADFGLAKLLRRETTDHTLTHSGMTLGTPRYMAPEQLDKPETVDHRADIYSLGVVFYEMLTGEVPMGRFAPPSERVRIDVRLDEIVLHALERDADRRYQHASEVRDDVEKVTGKPPVAPAPTGSAARKREIAISLILMLAIFGVCYGLQGVIRTTVFTIVDNSRGALDATARTFELMKFTFFLSGAATAMGLTILGQRRGNDRLLRICALVVVALGVFVPGDLIIHLCGLAGAGVAGWCWYALRKPVVKAPFAAVEAGNEPPASKPQPRHLLSTFLVLLFIVSLLFGISFHAKTAGTAAGLTTLITVGALDPMFIHERGTNGANTSFNFFSWSFLAVVVAGMAFSAVWRVGREDQGKVPRDPAWWRDWWTQAAIWGGLLLAVCIVRTAMDPKEVLQLPAERSVRADFNKPKESVPAEILRTTEKK